MDCPDFPYQLDRVSVVTADERLEPSSLAFRLASGSFRADVLACDWQVRYLDGRLGEGSLDAEEVVELNDLCEGTRRRVLAEGPTCVATDLKAALRELVDRSVAAQTNP